MEFHLIDIILHLINIVVLFVLLKMWVFKPVQSFMAARQERVAAQLEDADNQQMEAQNLKQELNQKLSSMNDTCEQMISESRKKGSDAAQKIIDNAEEKARNILQETRIAATSQQQQILDSAKVDIADLAVDMASRVLKFDQDILSQVVEPKEKKGTMKGTLKTATHCEKDTLSEMSNMLENLLGTNLHLDVQEDESLIGGFIAYINGQVYDFSYATQLHSMKQALQ
ncbi:F0F1 ATP synthase subunit B [Chakrabartyella piscis]|uniref:F0F1 ATP synthase subunit B n=1 Tax=Chakrabartyella piscis TaxID=2918914 RepID=UPI002958AB57|nr:F0F1 ATP synthase subunit B [Chakrabartyella piscis]